MAEQTEPTMQGFKYETPPNDHPRRMVRLARTDHIVAGIQFIKKGGEQGLHSHAHLDGFWFVLSGRARFYSGKDTVFAEIGRYEGVLVPRGTRYWFEAVGDEPLELMQVEASDIPLRTREEMRKDITYYEGAGPGSIPMQAIEAKPL